MSLYPYATQGMAFRLLAVLLLFAAVRNNVASRSALKRLAVVALANAVLLSLFALIQFFTSKPGVRALTCASQLKLPPSLATRT